MKTPKRYQNKPLPMMPEDNVVDDCVIEIWCARAKRKNKIAQLKRTIDKYKNGIKLFHERSNLKTAYLSIQKLGELEQTASLAECRGHLLLVDGIIKTLRWEQEKALRYMEIILSKHLP